MNYAYSKIEKMVPFTIEKIERLNPEDITYLDQLIYRFTKLQDAIGEKLFKSVLILIEEEVINKPFIDILNRLEQLGIIEDAEQWKDLREIRNELAHEYEEDLHETERKLNALIKSKVDLEKDFLSTLNYIKKRGFIE